MNHAELKAELDSAIKKFEKQSDYLQGRGMDDDTQEAVNVICTATLTALKDFRAAILKHCD